MSCKLFHPEGFRRYPDPVSSIKVVYESDLVVMVWRIVAELDAGPYGFAAVDAGGACRRRRLQAGRRGGHTRVEHTVGPVDGWVNAAFATIFARFDDITSDEFGRATEVSYLGFVHGTMAAVE